MIPTPGRTVEFTLSAEQADGVNRRRRDGQDSGITRESTGAVVHIGNDVREGDTFPLIITRVWGETEDALVNGQVLLDGNDSLWVTSVGQGEGPRTWRQYPRV